MRTVIKSIGALALASLLWVACDKKLEDTPSYGNGTAPTLTASSSTLASTATDSTKTVVTFNWTNPGYASDSAKIKYVIEIDSTGRNFSKAVTKTVTGMMSTAFTGKEMNEILLGFGFKFNTAYDIDVRVTSSYANNNDQKVSNTLKLKATPYLIPPKVALPASRRLFIVGDASQFGWDNNITSIPAPRELARIDSTTWVGVFYFTGSGEYLILHTPGNWAKYNIADNGVAGAITTGAFNAEQRDNFKGPTTAGWYKLTMDFQSGRYTCVPHIGAAMPAAGNLFIVGSATAGGWSNPVPVATQQFTRLNSVVWQLNIALNANAEYLLLPVNGDWGNKFALPSNTVAGANAGGWMISSTGAGDNFPSPATAGNYRITVNLGLQNPAAPASTAQYTVTKL